MTDSFYSNDDVQQILRQASRLQHDGSVSREQLSEIAAEVGISPEILQQAERAWLTERQVQQRQARYRLGFKLHLIPYIVTSAFLVLLNLATTPRIYWSIYPVLGWGLGVAIHGACISGKSEKLKNLHDKPREDLHDRKGAPCMLRSL